MIFQQKQAISTNTKTAVTDFSHEFSILFWKKFLAIIDYHKIVPGTLIFVKSEFHTRTKI